MSDDAPEPPSGNPPRSLFRSHPDDLYVPGAGTLGVIILVVSLSMLFAASIVGYIVIRFVKNAGQPWPPAGFPHLPSTLWLSTLVILATSVSIQYAYSSIRRDRQAELTRGLALTLGLGTLFLILQVYNWWEVYAALPTTMPADVSYLNAYLSVFYIFTSLHAAHVIGGMIPLIVVLIHAARRKYSANFHPGPRYCAIYWHFLDVVWVILFTLVYLV